MKLFNSSKLMNEAGVQALIEATNDPEKLEAMTSMIKEKLLKTYQLKVFRIPDDFSTSSYVIAANHLTDSDAPLIMGVHDKIMQEESSSYEKMLVFAKENCFNGVSIPKELVPVLEQENVVGVDRNSISGSMVALKTAIKWFGRNEKPKHFLIFAQGTIYDINKEMVEDIEKGAFWLSRQLQIPLLPAFIEQAVEGEENRLIFGSPFQIPGDARDLTAYKERWIKSVISAQDSLLKITGKPARTVELDPDHQVRKRHNH